jgi:hypothetical protein
VIGKCYARHRAKEFRSFRIRSSKPLTLPTHP